jgi:hypothetical protein
LGSRRLLAVARMVIAIAEAPGFAKGIQGNEQADY